LSAGLEADIFGLTTCCIGQSVGRTLENIAAFCGSQQIRITSKKQ